MMQTKEGVMIKPLVFLQESIHSGRNDAHSHYQYENKSMV